ncbi:MAG: molybdopterin synthase sulfur carrier subunit [Nitriliruptorales bacterium]|nr:molybdopterin synthase sulfur carrier subunit [Nitriliruptorales bacterium]
MSIEVRVPTVLRKHTDGQKTVAAEGSTLRELVVDLERRNAGLGAALVGDDGSLHRFINVYVNDEDVRYLGGIETPLVDGDTVSILPAVAGG